MHYELVKVGKISQRLPPVQHSSVKKGFHLQTIQFIQRFTLISRKEYFLFSKKTLNKNIALWKTKRKS